MKRSTLIVFGLAAVVAVGYVAASPYLAVRAMRDAASAGDAPGVAKHVDFPALKDSLKASMTAVVMKSSNEVDADNPLAGAAAMFAMAFMGPMIDAAASPEGLTMLMKHGTILQPPVAAAEGMNQDQNENPDHTTATLDARMSYRDLSTFVVTLKDTSGSDAPLGLVFRRHGIASWKLTSLELPQ